MLCQGTIVALQETHWDRGAAVGLFPHSRVLSAPAEDHTCGPKGGVALIIPAAYQFYPCLLYTSPSPRDSTSS
eukprot:10888893-Prorocentrum_lima.AAC.1